MNVMKKIFALSILMLSGTALMAQDTIPVADSLKDPKIFISGFGGIISETSILHKGISECIGAAGALTLNHYLFVGAYGLSLTSKNTITDLVMHNNIADSTFFGEKLRLNFTHAGLWAGVIFFPKKTVHLGISSRLGWGSIRLVKADVNYINNANYLLDYMNDKVMVVTPEIDIEVAITSWLKCNIGLGYRFVTGVEMARYKDFKFNTPQLTFGLYFGGFYNKEDNSPNNQSENQEE